ncbi:MAG: prepilin-type N-terminal cleavage/methylation domain-containing protein [Planctomycetota bacterium]
MRRAFSLFELVVVVGIIAVLAAIAVPRLASGNLGVRLDAFEARIQAETLAAGELARSVGSARSIVVDPSNDLLLIYEGDSGVSGTPLVTIDFSAAPYGIDITDWSEGDKGHIVADGFGVFDSGFKVTAAIDGLSRSVTVDLPSPEPTADALGAGGGGR